MENTEKLDQILRDESNKLKARVSKIYENVITLLNRSFEEGKGEITHIGNGIFGYRLRSEIGKNKFEFIYSSAGFKQLRISTLQRPYGQQLSPVLDLKIIGTNFTLDKYVPSQKEPINRSIFFSIGDWEESLLGIITENTLNNSDTTYERPSSSAFYMATHFDDNYRNGSDSTLNCKHP